MARTIARAYDPFARGPDPVGVRTLRCGDTDVIGRPLPLEVWYPAIDAHAGQDLAEETRDSYEVLPGFPLTWQHAVRDAGPRPGRFPLVVFSHGYGGHRRQSTFLCTQIASHGYVVASVDHTGNTMLETMQAVAAAQAGAPLDGALATIYQFIELRPRDVTLAIDAVLADDLGTRVDASCVGVTGHSFGGWTALTAAARDHRIRAALPLAPVGGAGHDFMPPIFAEALDLRWQREVPTLFIVADGDVFLPLRGMHGLLERTPAVWKRMVVLCETDHLHFCDRAGELHELFRQLGHPGLPQIVREAIRPFDELCPAERSELAIRGLAVAHMDAHLKDNVSASRLLNDELEHALAALGVRASVHF